ncbi:MAG: hypothetical protein ACT4NY_23035 [Pseudonocardiales bacterium]
MITTLRWWYYRLRPPPENPDLLGRRVRRGTRINGVWKYNQQGGVIVDSWPDGDRRMYRILLDGDIGVVSTTLPIDNYLITEERGDTSGLVIDAALSETRLSRSGGWYGVGTRYSDYDRPRTPWGGLAHKARGWCRQRRI